MARTPTDDVLILALGQRREFLAARIKQLQTDELATMQNELAATEAKLKEIDPAILSLTEEAQKAIEDEAARVAAEAQAIKDAQAAEAVRVAAEAALREQFENELRQNVAAEIAAEKPADAVAPG